MFNETAAFGVPKESEAVFSVLFARTQSIASLPLATLPLRMQRGASIRFPSLPGHKEAAHLFGCAAFIYLRNIVLKKGGLADNFFGYLVAAFNDIETVFGVVHLNAVEVVVNCGSVVVVDFNAVNTT